MATGFHVDELPLISENEIDELVDWVDLPLINGGGPVMATESNRYSQMEDEDDEQEELGAKGVADVDYLPQEDGHIEIQKGDIVIIHGQTIDQKCYIVLNLRTGASGQVPSHKVTVEPSGGDGEEVSVPTKSNLQRGNVIRRKRNKSIQDKSRRTGSDYSSSFVMVEGNYQGLEPPEGEKSLDPNPLGITKSLPSPDPVTPDVTHSLPCDMETKRESVIVGSDAQAVELPVQYRRIEKYKVISLSGADKMGRPVVVFAACRLPPSYQISHDVLFEYFKYTLDKYVESDYTLVYFHHGLSSVNKPNYGWLYQVYKELDRKYKKNLKRLFIVHPTTFVKFMMGLFKPIISYKFGKKLVYINRLAELDSSLYTSQMDIPEEVIKYDRTLRTQPRSYVTSETRSSFYVPINQPLPSESSSVSLQFGVNLQPLYERSGEEIPLVMRKCVEYLSNESCLNVLGIFRRTPSQFTVQEVKKKFNSAQDVDFTTYSDPHLAATVLKMFLRELPEPLLCFETNSKISILRSTPEDNIAATCRDILDTLPSLNYNIVKYLLTFISKIVEREEVNKMSSTNLSIVFGPNLLWSQSEVASLNSMSEINRFTLLLIDNYYEIFAKH